MIYGRFVFLIIIFQQMAVKRLRKGVPFLIQTKTFYG